MNQRTQVEQASAWRQRIVTALLGLYVVPLSFLTLWAGGILAPSIQWSLLTWGLFAATAGAASLYVLLLRWESVASRKVTPTQLPNAASEQAISEQLAEQQAELNTTIESLQQQLMEAQTQRDELGSSLHDQEKHAVLFEREKQEALQRVAEIEEQLLTQKKQIESQIADKDTLLDEYQKTISEQRDVIEKKSQQIEELDARVKDLNYELKTVLNCANSEVAETDPKEPVKSTTESRPTTRNKVKAEKAEAPDPHLDLGLAAPNQTRSEAQSQLKRCVDIAQKLTGARHLAGDSSRFRDLSSDGYALDLRRLCDSLRSEQSSMILLYSQREQRLLFTNNQVRGMLGWSPEKFVQNFNSLIIRGQRDLQNTLKKTGSKGQGEVSVVMRSRAGEERCLHCLLEVIPTGLFKGHILGVLYPVSFRSSQ